MCIILAGIVTGSPAISHHHDIILSSCLWASDRQSVIKKHQQNLASLGQYMQGHTLSNSN